MWLSCGGACVLPTVDYGAPSFSPHALQSCVGLHSAVAHGAGLAGPSLAAGCEWVREQCHSLVAVIDRLARARAHTRVFLYAFAHVCMYMLTCARRDSFLKSIKFCLNHQLKLECTVVPLLMSFVVNHKVSSRPMFFLATSLGLVKGKNYSFWFVSSLSFSVPYQCYRLELGALDLKTIFIH